MTATENNESRVEGYDLVGKRYDLSRHVFVQRSAGRGRPWLRFLKKIDAPGYWVTAYQTLQAAKAGSIA